MKRNEFVINGRFLVNAAMHTISDRVTGSITKLEPRLMKLLVLLAANQGMIISKDEIFREIGNKYHDAELGLNQAVAFLQKVFSTVNNECIRVFPGQGYMLDALVYTEKISDRKLISKKLMMVLIPVVLVLAGTLLFYLTHRDTGSRSASQDIVNDSTNQYRNIEESGSY